MIFAKFDVVLATHPRPHVAEEASPGSMGMYAWAMLYVRSHDGDGDLPKAALKLSWCHHRTHQKHTDALVKAGLWRVEGDTIVIEKYAKKNETRDAIEARRLGDRSRKQHKPSPIPVGIQKDSVRNFPGFPDSDSDSDSGISLEGSAEGNPPTAVEVPQVEPEPATAHERYARAYSGGQMLAGAEAFPWPSGLREEAALAHMCKFAGKLRGSELLAWFTSTSCEYRQSQDALYSCGYPPSKCLLWLQAGRPKSIRKAVQGVPSTGREWEIKEMF